MTTARREPTGPASKVDTMERVSANERSLYTSVVALCTVPTSFVACGSWARRNVSSPARCPRREVARCPLNPLNTTFQSGTIRPIPDLDHIPTALPVRLHELLV